MFIASLGRASCESTNVGTLCVFPFLSLRSLKNIGYNMLSEGCSEVLRVLGMSEAHTKQDRNHTDWLTPLVLEPSVNSRCHKCAELSGTTS